MEAASTYPAGISAGSSLGYAGNQKTVVGKAQPDRPMTEMESISASLGDLVRRLSMTNDDSENRIARFLQAPTTLGNRVIGDAPEAPEPQPGTIGSIKHLIGRLDAEVSRARSLEGSIAGIL